MIGWCSFKILIPNGFLKMPLLSSHCIFTPNPQSQVCDDALSFLLPFSERG